MTKIVVEDEPLIFNKTDKFIKIDVKKKKKLDQCSYDMCQPYNINIQILRFPNNYILTHVNDNIVI